jgi:hypothetical protein
MMNMPRLRTGAAGLRLSALLAMALPAACSAQSDTADDGWVLLGRTTRATVYLDTSRVETVGRASTVWLRVNYAAPASVPGEPGEQIWGSPAGTG